MQEAPKRKTRDAVSRHIHSLGNAQRLVQYAERTGISIDRLRSLKLREEERIKYLEALQLCIHSNGILRMADFEKRNVPDRERFLTPLGQKIALALSDGTPLAQVLREHGISHVVFKRWLEDNARWNESSRARLISAFTRNGVTIDDFDFEEQLVARLYMRYTAAKNALEKRRTQQLEIAN